MARRVGVLSLLAVVLIAEVAFAQQPANAPRITVVKAGRLIDPDTGIAATNQVIII